MTPHIVSDSARLEELAAQLSGATSIALDTEFLRERTYRPQLCLLQLSGNGATACVDPLAALSLEPLKPLLSGGPAPKILHAARQDLEVLWPVFGPLDPVYDTQIAASLVGLPAQIGYSELVRRLLGIELSKAETRTDWSRRPLTDAQLHYAVDDVAHLQALRELLDAQLAKLGRLGWLEEDLRGLARADLLFVDPEKAVDRLRWSSELDPDRARLAQRLAAWRERRAMDRDRPRSWILDDAGLRTIVLRAPRTEGELAALPDLTPGFVERSGGAILELVQAANMPATLPPLAQRQRPDPELQASVKRLGSALQARAQELSLASEVLATRRDLESIARGAPIAQVLHGWRSAELEPVLTAAL
jgi:ribonuclease D